MNEIDQTVLSMRNCVKNMDKMMAHNMRVISAAFEAENIDKATQDRVLARVKSLGPYSMEKLQKNTSKGVEEVQESYKK